MKDISSLIANIHGDIDKIINHEYSGITTGFNNIDMLTGRIGAGQIWTIGGGSGTGKSFFLLNMIENIMQKEQQKNLVLFSTELSDEAYFFRHILMRAGVYKLQFAKNPDGYKEKILEETKKYMEERSMENNKFTIYSDINSFEGIEKYIKLMKQNNCLPDMVFIDYVQELSVAGKYREDEIMALVPNKFKNLAKETNVPFVIASQVNNYTLTKAYSQDSSGGSPFSFGKHLNNVSHVSISLVRNRVNGKNSKLLTANILKARDGETGKVYFMAENGGSLAEVDSIKAEDILALEKKGKSVDFTYENIYAK